MINSVIDLLIKTESRYSDRLALKECNKSYTWRDVLTGVKSIASGLIERDNCLSNSRIPIPVFMDKSIDELVAFWGIAYTGNFYVPLDTKMPIERIEKILSTLNAKYIICDSDKIEFFNRQTLTVLNYNDLLETHISEEEIELCRKKIVDTDPLYALFTSGSTGDPKGVVCCHRSVLNYSEWVVETFGFNYKTISGNQTPFYFSMSVLDIYSLLRCGGELNVIPTEFFMQPKKLIDYLNEEKINTIYWVPSALCVFSKLRALEKYRIDSLRKVLFAGEVMPTKQLNYWINNTSGILFANLFGPTEITDIGIYYIVDRELSDSEPVPIGKACDNVGILILNEDGNQVNENEVGELYYRGTFLGLGYYGDWNKTNSTYVQNPLNSVFPELVYKSGDLVKYNERGELIYVGRIDSQIKHLGYRIELGEIENAISTVEEVDRVCCFLDSEKDRIIAAFSTRNDGRLVNMREEIERKIKELIPSYMLPGQYVEMDTLPLNANGKLDRKKIIEMYK